MADGLGSPKRWERVGSVRFGLGSARLCWALYGGQAAALRLLCKARFLLLCLL